MNTLTCRMTVGLLLLAPAAMAAQGRLPLSREAAIARALADAPELRVAAADTVHAAGALLAARLPPDPALSASWTKSVPRWHAEVEWPLALFGARGATTRAAEAWRGASQVRWRLARLGTATAADTSYTRALEARDRADLSRHEADDGRELLRIATARQDAGDASAFDVELARLEAGRLQAGATSDSLAAEAAVLELRVAIGLDAHRELALTDSMAPPMSAPSSGTLLSPAEQAARAAVEASVLDLAAARRGRFAGINLLTGVEFGDPGGGETGLLPVLGISVPLPLFNRQRGEIAMAEADRSRAEAELAMASMEAAALRLRMRQLAAASRAMAASDDSLLRSAERVAAMATTAYREGEAPLATVLEARRTARETRLARTGHLADLLVAMSVLRFLDATLSGSAP